uniref:RhbG n=1 Tax=Eptatretus stoutii TaxID=7765 RepID=A0A1W5PRA9_EPTST|nr:RhbG [Eptatretus stoutii]
MAIYHTKMNPKLPVVALVFEVVILILFGIFVRYDHDVDAKEQTNTTEAQKNEFYFRYPSFQDVHVMIFIGFGFLMTFLKRYSFSSVGFNFLIAAFGLQWAVLLQGWLHHFDSKTLTIHIGMEGMINADFCTAAVLISFGAVLGKTSPLQLLVMTVLEEVFFALNEHIAVSVLKVNDAGGSMVIHLFGAYFGLAVSRVMFRDGLHGATHEKEGSVYHSDLFAMIGTIFLWMFWPSFNSAIAAHGDDQMRAAMNTYLSLAASLVAAFAISSLTCREGKLDMVHIQNASLAGGVAVGTCADMMINPYGAIVIGFCSGAISTLGFKYLTPLLASKLKVHDTCGVHNLHGIPGILGGLSGAIAAAFASEEVYGLSLYLTFPTLVPNEESSPLFKRLHTWRKDIEPGQGRSPAEQGGYQALQVLISLIMAIGGGLITGFFLKHTWWGQPSDVDCFEDSMYWEVPEAEGFEEVKTEGEHPLDSQDEL